MSKKPADFRVGRVQAYLRGRVWYLCYHENGVRRRPKVGPDRDAAKQMAAQINAQLETGAPAALSFEAVSVPALREAWLRHHEQSLRSSVQTINRYRAATDHLLRFVADVRPVKSAALFRTPQAEEFLRRLRTLEVAPNGHPNTAKRRLLDKGVLYIAATCRSLFNFAAKRRWLPPYAENPFSALDIDRMPVEDSKPVTLLTPAHEKAFLEACDDWQFPVFLTLMLTGLRPGELTHLLLPDDLDLEARLLYVRNRPQLGWQVKTRNEREVPLVPALAAVLRRMLAGRRTGPLFRRRRFVAGSEPPLCGMSEAGLRRESAARSDLREREFGRPPTRAECLRIARGVWRDAGAVKPEAVREEFMSLTARIGIPESTAPKVLRHMFATLLQDANVDPLIRNELMGHQPAAAKGRGSGLGMTAVYTHTRPETRRRQLESALSRHVGIALAEAKSGAEPTRQPAGVQAPQTTESFGSAADERQPARTSMSAAC